VVGEKAMASPHFSLARLAEAEYSENIECDILVEPPEELK